MFGEVAESKEIPMRLRILALMAVGTFGRSASVARDKPKTDAKLIQGSWECDPATKQSDAKPQILLERVVIKGDTLTCHYNFDGKRSTSSTEFKLDHTATPKQIEFTPHEGGEQGREVSWAVRVQGRVPANLLPRAGVHAAEELQRQARCKDERWDHVYRRQAVATRVSASRRTR
jgi:uncharacterized protein (TIGR03067 family)